MSWPKSLGIIIDNKVGAFKISLLKSQIALCIKSTVLLSRHLICWKITTNVHFVAITTDSNHIAARLILEVLDCQSKSLSSDLLYNVLVIVCSQITTNHTVIFSP